MLELGVISLMPEMLEGLRSGITGRALLSGLAKLNVWNPREWFTRPYRQVDDKPYGGGPGMVLMYEPLNKAILCAKAALPGVLQDHIFKPARQKNSTKRSEHSSKK